MNPPKTILTGIDFTLSDEKVIAYAALFQDIYKSNLIFYHVIDPESAENAIDDVEGVVRKRVEDYLGKPLPENASILIEEGNRRSLFVQQSGNEDIDMIILGRKAHKKRPLLTSRLLNSSGCAICLVPDNANTEIKNIVVGVDFSEESKKGLEEAITIAKYTKADVHCINVYTVPWGFYSTGKDYNEFAAIMEKNALKAAQKFTQEMKYSIPLNFHYALDKNMDPSDDVHDFAKQMNADIVCVGSRGMSSFAAIFFESTLDKIIRFSNDTPLLIAMDKDRKRGVLDIIRAQ